MAADAFLLRRKLISSPSASRLTTAAAVAVPVAAPRAVGAPEPGGTTLVDDLGEGEPFDTQVFELSPLLVEGAFDGIFDMPFASANDPANSTDVYEVDGAGSDTTDGTDSARRSYVRIRPEPGVEIVQRFLEEIGSSQLTLTMRLNELERAMNGITDRKATRVASTTLSTRVAELDKLRDALNDLYMAAATPEVADALAQDGAFTEYLRGVYAWAESVLRALSILCTELVKLSPDWFRLRSRINDASDFYMGELEPDVRASVSALRRAPNGDHETTVELEERVEVVLAAASRLYAGLALRFG